MTKFGYFSTLFRGLTSLTLLSLIPQNVTCVLIKTVESNSANFVENSATSSLPDEKNVHAKGLGESDSATTSKRNTEQTPNLSNPIIIEDDATTAPNEINSFMQVDTDTRNIPRKDHPPTVAVPRTFIVKGQPNNTSTSASTSEERMIEHFQLDSYVHFRVCDEEFTRNVNKPIQALEEEMKEKEEEWGVWKKNWEGENEKIKQEKDYVIGKMKEIIEMYDIDDIEAKVEKLSGVSSQEIRNRLSSISSEELEKRKESGYIQSKEYKERIKMLPHGSLDEIIIKAAELKLKFRESDTPLTDSTIDLIKNTDLNFDTIAMKTIVGTEEKEFFDEAKKISNNNSYKSQYINNRTYRESLEIKEKNLKVELGLKYSTLIDRLKSNEWGEKIQAEKLKKQEDIEKNFKYDYDYRMRKENETKEFLKITRNYFLKINEINEEEKVKSKRRNENNRIKEKENQLNTTWYENEKNVLDIKVERIRAEAVLKSAEHVKEAESSFRKFTRNVRKQKEEYEKLNNLAREAEDRFNTEEDIDLERERDALRMKRQANGFFKDENVNGRKIERTLKKILVVETKIKQNRIQREYEEKTNTNSDLRLIEEAAVILNNPESTIWTSESAEQKCKEVEGSYEKAVKELNTSKDAAELVKGEYRYIGIRTRFNQAINYIPKGYGHEVIRQAFDYKTNNKDRHNSVDYKYVNKVDEDRKEAKAKAEEYERKEEAKRKADEEKKEKIRVEKEAENKRKEEEETKRKAAVEAKRKVEEERKSEAVEEAKQRVESDAKKKAEEKSNKKGDSLESEEEEDKKFKNVVKEQCNCGCENCKQKTCTKGREKSLKDKASDQINNIKEWWNRPKTINVEGEVEDCFLQNGDEASGKIPKQESNNSKASSSHSWEKKDSNDKEDKKGLGIKDKFWGGVDNIKGYWRKPNVGEKKDEQNLSA